MLTKDQIRNSLKSELPYLQKRFHVQKLSFFGSFSRSEQTSESDVDILVTFSEIIDLFEFIELENHLRDVLGCNVDLVMENKLKDRIKDTIINEAVLI